MSLGSPRRALLLGALFASLLSGCSSAPPPPDQEMTTAPTGLWNGVTNPEVSLDIQDGGYFKMIRSGQEMMGKWEMAGADQMTVELGGQSYTCPFKRLDLNLSITLPGESTMSTFTQM